MGHDRHQQQTNKATHRSIMTSKKNGCPFQPRRGYVDARSDYLYHFHNKNAIEDDDKNNKLPTKSLMASTNIEEPLFFWQLYSLMGVEPIVDLITDFYDRVYADTDNPWFRNVFVQVAPKHHHIHAQVAYWVDAFGGGRYYHGGNYRLTFHHTHNAREIMTRKGAQRWMVHMRAALMAKQSAFKDPRILPCIVTFLETKMRTYAMDHGWNFDKADFAPLKESFNNMIAKEEDPTIEAKESP